MNDHMIQNMVSSQMIVIKWNLFISFFLEFHRQLSSLLDEQ